MPTLTRFAVVVVAIATIHLLPLMTRYLYFDAIVAPADAAVRAASFPVVDALIAIGATIIGGGDPAVIENPRPRFGTRAAVTGAAYVLGFLVVSVAMTTLWTLLDRRRTAYASLAGQTRVYARYLVAVVLLEYAMSKVIPTQFGVLRPGEMLRHLGEVSRFDMLWTFMAASPGYTVFTGLVELLAALLLFWRATAVLGALLAAAAMTNVVALDLAFDLRGPLLIAMLLLVLSIIVLAPHLRALGSFLVVSSTDRMVRPVGTVGNDRPRIWTVVNMIAVVCLLAMQVQSRVTQREAMFAGRPLYGLWDVESIPPDDPARQTGLADSSAWRRVGSGGRNRDNGLFVELVSGDVRYFGLVDDGTQRTWTLRQRNEEVAVLHYQLEPGGAVLLDGRIGKVPVKMRLRGVDPARVQLLDLR